MSAEATEGAVFVQTNEPENAVVVFRRSAAGSLERLGSYPTGGSGSGEPHLPSQGSVVLTGDGRHLLVTNVASDDVSVFGVREDLAVGLIGRTPAGTAPRSVTERDGIVYVMSTGKPAVIGFRLTGSGLEPIPSGETALSSLHADPAQVSFSPDGTALVVTERGADMIVSFPVKHDGSLGALQAIPSSGPTPYGFGFTSGGTLVVTEAFRAQKGAAAASSYSVRGTTITPLTRSVGNGRSEICWAAVTPDDRFAFTTNFADGAVSRYRIGPDGELTLEDATAGLSVDGRAGLRDEALTADGRYLYALDADSGSIFGWAVGDAGSLSSLGSCGGLPAAVAGLAAR
jgi:6-phosphogluconolactonase (cycloisomerase 2 family)